MFITFEYIASRLFTREEKLHLSNSSPSSYTRAFLFQVQRHGMEITTGYNTFKHEHDSVKRPRDYKRLFGQKRVRCIPI